MYLKNVVRVGDEWLKLESVNKKLNNIGNWWFVCSPDEGPFLERYQYDFNTAHCDERDSYETRIKNKKEITEISLMSYKYKILPRVDIAKFDVYRIPRTFTIAYNDTALISASMRANLHYLFWQFECKDIMRVITEHLFNVVKYDYSLYICAN